MRIWLFSARISVWLSLSNGMRLKKDSYDFVADLAARRLPADVWKELAQTFFTPRSENGRTEYRELRGKEIMLFVPQKLVSDEKCGVSARQKSLPMDVFAFLKRQDSPLLPVLLQNFDRETDLDAVKRVAADFGLYVPGLTENPNCWGFATTGCRICILFMPAPDWLSARLAPATGSCCVHCRRCRRSSFTTGMEAACGRKSRKPIRRRVIPFTAMVLTSIAIIRNLPCKLNENTVS